MNGAILYNLLNFEVFIQFVFLSSVISNLIINYVIRSSVNTEKEILCIHNSGEVFSYLEQFRYCEKNDENCENIDGKIAKQYYLCEVKCNAIMARVKIAKI